MAAKDTTLTDRHDAYLGIDVGKETHWAYALDSMGTVLLSRRIANSEADLDTLMTR